MKQKLKVDLHVHTGEDPYEKIRYSAYELIDRAWELGFDVLAITNHNTVTNTQELTDYAEQKGILLLPGMEGTFSRKHAVVINPGIKITSKDETLEDLANLRSEKSLIIAAHPFFPGSSSLRSLFFDYLYLFDAIEFCHCYNHLVNFNKKAIQSASLYNKPLVGTSDSHNLWQFGRTYTLVEAEKSPLSVIQAVKKGKVEIVTYPLSVTTLSRVGLNFIISQKLKFKHRI